MLETSVHNMQIGLYDYLNVLFFLLGLPVMSHK